MDRVAEFLKVAEVSIQDQSTNFYLEQSFLKKKIQKNIVA